jgi:hypothetical protein
VIIIVFLYIRTFLRWNVIGLQIAHLSRSSFLFIPFPEIGFSLSFFLNSLDLLAMLLIPGAVLTTEHIHKFIMDGPGVFALHGSSTECAIYGFRHIRVCDLRLYANLFLSSLQELCSTPISPRLFTRDQPFKPHLNFAQVNPSKFSGNSSLQC